MSFYFHQVVGLIDKPILDLLFTLSQRQRNFLLHKVVQRNPLNNICFSTLKIRFSYLDWLSYIFDVILSQRLKLIVIVHSCGLLLILHHFLHATTIRLVKAFLKLTVISLGYLSLVHAFKRHFRSRNEAWVRYTSMLIYRETNLIKILLFEVIVSLYWQLSVTTNYLRTFRGRNLTCYRIWLYSNRASDHYLLDIKLIIEHNVSRLISDDHVFMPKTLIWHNSILNRCRFLDPILLWSKCVLRKHISGRCSFVIIIAILKDNIPVMHLVRA